MTHLSHTRLWGGAAVVCLFEILIFLRKLFCKHINFSDNCNFSGPIISVNRRYMAPEILEEDGKSRGERTPYTKKVDIWSVGVTLYKMLSNQIPFESETEVRAGNLKFKGLSKWLMVSVETKTFIKKMVEKDPRKRYSIGDVLGDDWMKNDVDAIKKFNEIVGIAETQPQPQQA